MERLCSVVEHDHLKLHQGHFRIHSEGSEALPQRSVCRQRRTSPTADAQPLWLDNEFLQGVKVKIKFIELMKCIKKKMFSKKKKNLFSNCAILLCENTRTQPFANNKNDVNQGHHKNPVSDESLQNKKN